MSRANTGSRDVNVEGTRNVVQACRRAGVRRLVHFSSVHAYHQVPLDQPIDETRPLADVASAMAYDRSKAQGEAEVMAGVGQGLDAVGGLELDRAAEGVAVCDVMDP